MISRASSRRRTGSPNSLVVTAVPPRPRLSGEIRGGFVEKTASLGAVLHGGGGVPDGLLDVGVAGAPAEVAADDLVDLVLGDLRRPVAVLEPGLDRHQEARRAEPALQRVALAERLLHRVQLVAALAVV